MSRTEKAYQDAMARLRIPLGMEGRVMARILEKQEKKERWKMMWKKRAAVFAAVAVAAVCATGIAAGTRAVQWNSGSSGKAEYTALPSAEEVRKDIGYDAALLERFSNGYTFREGSVVRNSLEDAAGNTMEKFKSLSFRYERDGDEVDFSQERYTASTEHGGVPVASEQGVDIYYSSYTNKLVPADYQLTPQEEEAQKKGELVFSYGDDEESVFQVQAVYWEKDHVHGTLLQLDGALTQEELVQMAREAINVGISE